MTKQVTACNPQTNAAAAAEMMFNQDIGILPVVEDGSGRPLGLVTDRDLFIALGTRNQRASELPVGDVMRTGLSLCSPDDDVQTALNTMAQQRLHRLPVVDETGALQGILSLNDVALKAGSDGLSRDDVARTLKAICGHSEGPQALAQRSSKTQVSKAQTARA
jgi:CBS domain-containing protein